MTDVHERTISADHLDQWRVVIPVIVCERNLQIQARTRKRGGTYNSGRQRWPLGQERLKQS